MNESQVGLDKQLKDGGLVLSVPGGPDAGSGSERIVPCCLELTLLSEAG